VADGFISARGARRNGGWQTVLEEDNAAQICAHCRRQLAVSFARTESCASKLRPWRKCFILRLRTKILPANRVSDFANTAWRGNGSRLIRLSSVNFADALSDKRGGLRWFAWLICQRKTRPVRLLPTRDFIRVIQSQSSKSKSPKSITNDE